MPVDVLRNTRGACATTRKPSDSTETCALGDNAALTAPIDTKRAYQMNAAVLISSRPARKPAAVTAGNTNKLSGYRPPVPGSAIFCRKTEQSSVTAQTAKLDCSLERAIAPADDPAITVDQPRRRRRASCGRRLPAEPILGHFMRRSP